tara:strand:- start:383 stop:1585 length:1203 start_codon:yes stop_codon:yes gene_type:complete
MKNEICLFTTTQDLSKIKSIYGDVIAKIINNLGSFTIVNFVNLNTNSHKINQDLFDEKKYDKIKFFYPSNNLEFNNFIKNKNILAIDGLGKKLKHFKIRYLINKKQVKLILIQNLGFFSNEILTNKKNSVKEKIFNFQNFFIKKIYRFFVLIKIFSPIFLYFESREDIVNNCLKDKKNKLGKLLPFLNISYFKNIFKINSKIYDNFKNNKFKVSKEDIIFIDGNYKHEDVIIRENLDIIDVKNKYFEQLKIFLERISKIFNQKVQICLHPSSDFNEYNNYFKNFSISQFETEKKIFSSSIVIFHESSSIIDAIYLKKNIISLDTDLFGIYFSNRINLYKKELDLFSIKLGQDFNISKDKILQHFDRSVHKYTDFINKNLHSDSDETGEDKIIRILQNYFA